MRVTICRLLLVCFNERTKRKRTSTMYILPLRLRLLLCCSTSRPWCAGERRCRLFSLFTPTLSFPCIGTWNKKKKKKKKKKPTTRAFFSCLTNAHSTWLEALPLPTHTLSFGRVRLLFLFFDDAHRNPFKSLRFSSDSDVLSGSFPSANRFIN